MLITGASTGIGQDCARTLAHRGYLVFAGVRKESDAERLRAEGLAGLRPVLLDITREDSIAHAAGQIREATAREPSSLPFCLINNAGITVSGPLEFVGLDDFRRQLEVNLTGTLAVTQRFLPWIRESQGRILITSSIMGRVGWPFAGPYVASKFALEGLAECLRLELAPFGVPVTLIEPGAVATPIWEKAGLLRTASPPAGGSAGHGATAVEGVPDPTELPEAARAVYGTAFRGLIRMMSQSIKKADPPSLVTRTIIQALEHPRPRIRYLVGKSARLQAGLKAVLPARRWEALILLALRKFGGPEPRTTVTKV